MHRHLYRLPRPQVQRPAKVVQLEVRRQARHEAERLRAQRPARPSV
jgi:hypothetical protein